MSLPIAPNQPEQGPSPQGNLVTTPYAVVSFDLEQQLLDDIKLVVNQASGLLTSFSGDGGTVNINWLAQLQALSQASAGATGLFCLFHNPSTSPCSDAANDPSQGGGALLDITAVNALQNLIAGGAASPGVTIPAPLQQAWTLALQATAGERWAQLTACQQAALRDAYVDQRLGSLAISYPSTIGPETILDGLLEWQVSDVSFEIDINRTDVVKQLAITSPNLIHCVIGLPNVSGKAWLVTNPTLLYWEVVGFLGVGCWFLGFGCELLAEAIDVGVFLALNIDYLSLQFGSPQIVTDVWLQPDASQVMWPTASVSISADPEVLVLDVVPSDAGIILGLIVSAVASFTDLLPDLAAAYLTSALQGILQDGGMRFPLAESPITDQFASSEASGLADDYLDAISQENPAYSQTNPSEQMIRAEDQLTYRFRELVPAFPPNFGGSAVPCHLYGGFGISQNYLNLLINQEWAADYFAFGLPPGGNDGISALAAALEAAVPGLQLGEAHLLTAELSPDTSPRLLLTEHDALAGRNYAVAHFDDLRLWLTDGEKGRPATQVIEFRFGAQMPAQVSLGTPSSGQLDIVQINPTRGFDIYYDLASITLDPAVQSVATYGATVAGVTDAALAGLQEIFATLVQAMLARNPAAWIQRQPGDPITLQRYPLGQSSWVVCQLNVARGNLYAQLGLASPVLDILSIIDTLNCDFFKGVLGIPIT